MHFAVLSPEISRVQRKKGDLEKEERQPRGLENATVRPQEQERKKDNREKGDGGKHQPEKQGPQGE